MDRGIVKVSDAASLRAAVAYNTTQIEIGGLIEGLDSLTLPAGVNLSGSGTGAGLQFVTGQPGLLLTADHRIAGLRLLTDDAQMALGLADTAKDLGRIVLQDIVTVGRVHLEASTAVAGAIELANLHVERADARMVAHRPAGFGVEVLLGGITVYNASRDRRSHWTLDARNLSGGSASVPLRGSGVCVFGGWSVPADADTSQAPAPTREGGGIAVRILTTGAIHADGGIPPGTGNLITGGVFTGSGVHAAEVVNEGTTTTYGPNDMVLDNWGRVDRWTAKSAVTSHGSSGIGFVNFGDIASLLVEAPVVTHGLGARGFNLYDGTLAHAEFHSITTFGDGAIGIQLSRPFGSIVVKGDIRTKGGEGDSLVRGKVVSLKANAFSIKPGARGERIKIGGTVRAEHVGIEDWDFQAPASVIDHIETGDPDHRSV